MNSSGHATGGGGGPEVGALVEHLFRRSHARLVAALARILGSRHLELAEDFVQEALVRALRRWPFHGVPADPEAWLVRVAHNVALDHLRRDASLCSKEDELESWARDRSRPACTAEDEARLEGELGDEALGLVFACCHPQLSPEARVALTLHSACGLSSAEIARAFLIPESTLAQRLVRARRRLSELEPALEIPPPGQLEGRLDSVLAALYLMFNEGAYRTSGDDVLRADIVDEALRLGHLLVTTGRTERPASHALMALMLLTSARFPARVDHAGELLRLAEQDRSRWDRRAMARGFAHLERAGAGDQLTRQHLEAGIAALHARAPSWEATDWSAILELYDLLLARFPSPLAALNRTVALAELSGPERALEELRAVEAEPSLARYHLRPALRGDLLQRCGRLSEARSAFREALELCNTGPERRLLEGRIAGC